MSVKGGPGDCMEVYLIDHGRSLVPKEHVRDKDLSLNRVCAVVEIIYYLDTSCLIFVPKEHCIGSNFSINGKNLNSCFVL